MEAQSGMDLGDQSKGWAGEGPDPGAGGGAVRPLTLKTATLMDALPWPSGPLAFRITAECCLSPPTGGRVWGSRGPMPPGNPRHLPESSDLSGEARVF